MAQRFEEAVAAWRASRDPQHAAIAEELAAREPERPALPASGKAKDVAAWSLAESAADWRDFPRLMATIAAGNSPLAATRVPLLARRDDPRIVPGLLAVLEDPPYTAGTSKKFWQSVVAALAATGDVRARDGMDSLSKRYKLINDTHLGAWLAGAMSKAAGAMKVAEAPKTPSKKAPATLDELLARVIEAPDDDDARLVYADAASERGDLRGEYIVLQVERAAGRGSPERADLERDKFAGAGKQLGLAISAAADRIDHERGFPARVELAIRGLSQVIDAPEWGTVQTLTRVDVTQVTPLLQFLDGHRLKSLVEVDALKAKWIDKLRTATFPWKRLTIVGEGLKAVHLSRFPALQQLVLRRCGRLTSDILSEAAALESVAIRDPATDAGTSHFTVAPKLRRLALGPRHQAERFAEVTVTELSVVANVADAGAWLEALPAVTSLELALEDTDWHGAVALFKAYPRLASLTLKRRRGEILLTREEKKGLTLTTLPTARWEKFYSELITAAPALREGGVTSFILCPEGPRHRVPPLHPDLIAMLKTAWPDLEHRDLL